MLAGDLVLIFGILLRSAFGAMRPNRYAIRSAMREQPTSSIEGKSRLPGIN
jgi:hypothetical protein